MSKHVMDISGEQLSLSNEIYIITRGENKGKRVRCVVGSETNYIGDFFSRTVDVCFLNSRYVETFTVHCGDIEMI
jgi:hypothetical protein